MNILELTGMKSTKYGGVESYFAELVKICRVDKFIFVYESMPISENYVNDINKWGGVILCKQSIEWRSEERRVGKECRSRWSPYH